MIDKTEPDIAGRDQHMERWYIAGPMRGYPQFNFPAFDAARDLMVRLGYFPISPADHDREVYPEVETAPGFDVGDHDGFTASVPNYGFESLVAWDIGVIVDPKTTGIALLPGWERSSGARFELHVAQTVGKEVGYVDPAKGWFGGRPHRQLVGLMGYAGAGKDLAAEGLTRKGWTRVAFADALKAVAHHVGWNGRKDAHGRILLQRLGVAVRDHVDPQAWVQAAERQIAKVEGDVVVTDVRFPNEVEFIRARHGVVVRVDRPGTGPLNDHASEHAWTGVEPDFVLVNDGDAKAVQRKLHNLTLRAA